MRSKKAFGFFICFAAVLMVALPLVIFGGADVRNVEYVITPEEPETYTVAQIESAMEVVKTYFRQKFEDCKLTELRYDEAYSDTQAATWADSAKGKLVIVLQSDFLVGTSGSDGSLTPNGIYTDWQWVLALNGSKWEILSNGY